MRVETNRNPSRIDTDLHLRHENCEIALDFLIQNPTAVFACCCELNNIFLETHTEQRTV